MQLNPYLMFNGQCEAAFRFYEKALGGKIETVMTYAGSPMADQTPPEWRNKVMHARLKVGDKILMGSDPPPDRYEPMKGFSVTLSIDDPERGRAHFSRIVGKRERYGCRYRRHSGPPALACSSTNSAHRGW